jgi:hypothetical protein
MERQRVLDMVRLRVGTRSVRYVGTSEIDYRNARSGSCVVVCNLTHLPPLVLARPSGMSAAAHSSIEM